MWDPTWEVGKPEAGGRWETEARMEVAKVHMSSDITSGSERKKGASYVLNGVFGVEQCLRCFIFLPLIIAK